MAGVKPIRESGLFEVPDEGVYKLQVSDVDFEKKEGKGWQATIKCETIECGLKTGENTGTDIGIEFMQFFPLYGSKNKKEEMTYFGLGRFLGFLVVAAGAPEDKEYPYEYFDDAKNQANAKRGAMGKLFGGVIKHVKGEKGTFTKITKFLTKEEIAKEIEELSAKGKGEKSTPAASALTKAPEQTEAKW